MTEPSKQAVRAAIEQSLNESLKAHSQAAREFDFGPSDAADAIMAALGEPDVMAALARWLGLSDVTAVHGRPDTLVNSRVGEPRSVVSYEPAENSEGQKDGGNQAL